MRREQLSSRMSLSAELRQPLFQLLRASPLGLHQQVIRRKAYYVTYTKLVLAMQAQHTFQCAKTNAPTPRENAE